MLRFASSSCTESVTPVLWPPLDKYPSGLRKIFLEVCTAKGIFGVQFGEEGNVIGVKVLKISGVCVVPFLLSQTPPSWDLGKCWDYRREQVTGKLQIL